MLKRKASISSRRTSNAKRPRTSTPQPRVQSAGYKLYKTVKQEFKIWDRDLGLAGTSASGTIYNLASAGATTAALTRGSDYFNNFIGQNLDIAGIQLRYEVVGCSDTAFVIGADENNTTRVMLFQWMDSTTPTPSGVLQSLDTLAPVFATNRENINVLSDKIYATYVQTQTSSASNSNNFVVKKYIKGFKCAPVQMDTGSATYQKGGLYLLVITDSAAVPHPQFRFYCRTTFTD